MAEDFHPESARMADAAPAELDYWRGGTDHALQRIQEDIRTLAQAQTDVAHHVEALVNDIRTQHQTGYADLDRRLRTVEIKTAVVWTRVAMFSSAVGLGGAIAVELLARAIFGH